MSEFLNRLQDVIDKIDTYRNPYFLSGEVVFQQNDLSEQSVGLIVPDNINFVAKTVQMYAYYRRVGITTDQATDVVYCPIHWMQDFPAGPSNTGQESLDAQVKIAFSQKGQSLALQSTPLSTSNMYVGAPATFDGSNSGITESKITASLGALKLRRPVFLKKGDSIEVKITPTTTTLAVIDNQVNEFKVVVHVYGTHRDML